MNAIHYLSAFRVYGTDVLLLALGVTLLTSLLKKTVLKNVSKKVFVALPYLLGFVAYLVYRMIVTLSVAPLTQTPCLTLEGGFAVGCAATLYYVVYEQFFRANKGEKADVLAPILKELLPEENVAPVSALLKSAHAEQTDEEFSATARTALRENGADLSDAELDFYVALIAKYLAFVEKL